MLAAGPDLDALREQLRPRLRAQLAAATAPFERSGLRDWTIGELPRSIALPGTGESVRAYPALVDEGDSVAVRAFETPGAQAARDARGHARRCCASSCPRRCARCSAGLPGAAALTLAGAPHGGASAVLDDALNAAFDELIASGGGPAWDEAGFAALRAHVAQRLPATTPRDRRRGGRVLDAAAELRARLDALSADPALQPARLDVAGQLGSLVHPGFIAATGTDRLPDVVRYLRAAARRLERLPDAVAADRDRMNAIARARARVPRPRRPRRRARRALDAAGAARRPVRAGPGHARAGVGEAGAAGAGGARRRLSRKGGRIRSAREDQPTHSRRNPIVLPSRLSQRARRDVAFAAACRACRSSSR